MLERSSSAVGPKIAVLYYRAHHLSGNTGFVEDLCTAIEAAGGSALPVFTASLRSIDEGPLETLTQRGERMAELFAARHSLSEVALQARRIGTNVNQIAKAANQGQALPVDELRTYLVDADQLLRTAREVAGRIDVAVDELHDLGVVA